MDVKYTTEDLLSVINSEECAKNKPIIVEVVGERIPLRHVYIVTQELIDEGCYSQDQLGTLVIDLDV